MWVCDEVLHVLYEVPEAGRFVPFSSCTILGSSGLFQFPCVLSYFPVARLYRRRLSIRPWYVGLTMDFCGSSLSIVQTSFSSSESWTSSMTTSSHLLLFRLCVSSCVLAVKLRICFETNLLAASHVLCGCSPPSFGAPGSVGKTLYCCDTGGISVVALTRTVYTGGSVAATVLACTGSWGLLAGVSCAEDVAVTLTSGGGTA